MKRFNVVGIVLCLSIFVTVACSAAGQKAGSQSIEGSKVTVTGKIGYMKNLDAYIVKGENPADEYFVVNPDNKVLEALYKSQKTITIKGHYTIGADHLFIETLDGKAYKGTTK